MNHLNQYAQTMKCFQGLFALWSPEQASRLKPAMCGYFDSEGDWNTIIDLRDIHEEDGMYTMPPEIPRAQLKSLGKWQPVCSEGVSWVHIALDMPVKIPEVGVEFKSKLEFKKERGYAASLITGPSVLEKYIEHPKTLFHKWAKQNYRSISHQYPDVRKHGLWIITKVFETPRCAISSWSGNEQSTSLYLGGGAFVGGGLTLRAAVGEKESNGSWRFFPNDTEEEASGWKFVTSKPSGRRGEKRSYIVFLGGMRYRGGLFGSTQIPITSIMRGEEEATGEEVKPVDGEEEDRLMCEYWGGS